MPNDPNIPAAQPANPPPGGAPPAMPPFMQTFGDQMGGVQQADKQAFEQEQSALAPHYSALSGMGKAPAPPPQQKLPDAPGAQEFQKDAMAWASAMAVLGAVSSRFTRMTGQQALNAFGGAVKGWQSGNLQAYENASKQWEQNTKKTIENNRQVLDAYKLTLQNRKMNIDEQMSQIQMIAAQYHDKLMYDAAAAKNYTLVAGIYEKGETYTAKAKDSADKLTLKREEDRQKAEQTGAYWLSPEGQAKLPTLSTTQQAAVQQLIEIYRTKASGTSSQSQLMAQYKQEHPDATAEEIQQFSAQGRPPRSAPAMALNQFMHEHPNATADEIKKFSADYAGEAAYQRTAGSSGARVENAVNEVEQVLPLAVEASHALPRGQYVPINRLIQQYQQGSSDPRYNDFITKNLSLVNAYTRAMNPQGVPRIAERLEQHAIGVLSTATSQEAYDIQARALWKEVQASKNATDRTRQGRTPGDINSPVPGLDTPPAARPGSVIRYDAQGNRISQ